MTIQAGLSATAADQLQIHNASGYLRLATPLALSLNVATFALAVPVQNFNTITLSSGTTGTLTTIPVNAAIERGFVLVLMLTTTTNTVTFTDTPTPAAGTLSLAGGFTMTGADASLTLIYNGTDWVELARTPGMTVGKVIALTTVFS